MASKKRAKRTPRQTSETDPFVQLVATATYDRIELEVGEVRVRLPPGFDPADLQCVLEALANR